MLVCIYYSIACIILQRIFWVNFKKSWDSLVISLKNNHSSDLNTCFSSISSHLFRCEEKIQKFFSHITDYFYVSGVSHRMIPVLKFFSFLNGQTENIFSHLKSHFWVLALFYLQVELYCIHNIYQSMRKNVLRKAA